MQHHNNRIHGCPRQQQWRHDEEQRTYMQTATCPHAQHVRCTLLQLAPLTQQHPAALCLFAARNAAAGMALPLCLDRLVNVGVALVLSTTAIVLFGEILPQVGFM
jgi:hypothetical protein